MNHKELDVWKKSISVIKRVYNSSNKMPESEKFGLTTQMRRAAISIPSNIAEGSARNSDQDLIKFLYYSLGSAAELETQLIISEELDFIQTTDELNEELQELKQLIIGLIRYLKSKKKT